MRWRVVAVGKPRLAFAREGIAEYLGRLRGFSTIEIDYVKASDSQREGPLLLARTEDCHRIVLDERGKQFTSVAFSEELAKIELHARKTCALIIGGACGHTPEVRSSADLLWSLSSLTLQHEMALVFALEQLYRAHTILKNIPYHKS